MKTILVTGGSGLVGSRLVELLSKRYRFVAPSSQELDITNATKVRDYCHQHSFDTLLHLAAYTNVDGAETNRELCHRLNVDSTRHLLAASQELDRAFILMSTDFVFRGEDQAYDENSPTDPIGYYGQTKAEAEQLVKGQGTILRISYPYRATFTPKRDFVRTIVALLKEGKSIKGITDSLFTPTFIDDIALNLDSILETPGKDIYHLVGSETLSPFAAFKQIAQIWELNEQLIIPVSYREYFANKALRPQFSRIINTKLPLQMRSFAQGLHLVKAAADC